MTFEEKKAKEYMDNEVPFDTTESGEKLYTRYDVEQAYIAGMKETLKMKVNTTTISDAPLMERERLERAKKIIKNLMVFAEIDLRESEKEYIEAEQFLKELSE